MDSSTRSIQAKDTKDQTEQSNKNVQDGEGDLAGRSKPLAVVQVQPVNTGQTVREPTREQSTDQAVQVTEDGNGFRDDPGNNPAGDSQADPQTDGAPVALVDQAGLGAEAEVDVL